MMKRSLSFAIAITGALYLAVGVRADEAEATKTIEKLGGSIVRSEKLAGKPVIEVKLDSKNVTDAGLVQIGSLKQL